MRGFIKKFTIFIYFLLALFVQPNNTFAYENIAQNTSQQRLILSIKPEAALINSKKEEYYAISKTQNRLEITNQSNKNDSFSFGDIVNSNVSSYILNNFIAVNNLYSIRISHNNSSNLKNSIYTRAP